MTEEELQKEVEEYISSTPTEGAKDFVVYKVKVGKNAFAYVVEHKNELCFSDWIKMYEGTERECYKVVGYLDYAKPREKQIAELEAQIEKMKKYGKLLQDICTVMGNDVYMVSVGLENRVKVLWDSSEEKEGLKMVEDIENRLLKIKPQEWAEITKWEIKEK